MLGILNDRRVRHLNRVAVRRPQIKLESMRPPTFHNGPYLPPEKTPRPGVVETLAGRKRIGEMSPDEYLELVWEAQRQLENPSDKRR